MNKPGREPESPSGSTSSESSVKAEGWAFSSTLGPCLTVDAKSAGLRIRPKGTVSYVVPYAHLIYGELGPMPEHETDPSVGPEKLFLRFAMLEVVIAGSGLSRAMSLMQRLELSEIRAVDLRLAVPNKTFVAEILVTPIQDFR